MRLATPSLSYRKHIALISKLCLVACLTSACEAKTSASDCATPALKEAALEWKMAFPSLPAIELASSLFQLPSDNNSWYVLRQPGVILRFANKADANSLNEALNIQDRVHYSKSSGGETGLLGVAVHPKFASNRYVFLYYTGKGDKDEVESRIVRYTVNEDGNFDKNSELEILRIARPFANHVGGDMAFDKQGYLYISSGDGGSANDPGLRGQNTSLLLGKILRIDINTNSEGRNYAIPKDNPLVGVANAREEIWAWGLRNPWRFSFDSLTQELWTGDVGQATWEEINIITRGGNYGWSDMEGDYCFSLRPKCSTENKIKPVYSINHDTGACSIIGGYVYRGTRYPQAYGKYFFTDYCESTMRSISYQANKKVVAEKYGSLVDSLLHKDSAPKTIVSFAQDNQSELYAIGQAEGEGKQIYALRAAHEGTSASSCSNATK